MPIEDYLKAPGISQSRLKMMNRSPAHFRYAIEEAEEEETRALVVGRVLHYAILEPDLFGGSHYVRPDTYKNKQGDPKKWNGNATECKEWLASHSDREVIFSKELEAIIGMRKSVMEHPAARAALAEGLAEQAMFMSDPDTGIGLKCRTDWLSGNTIVDLKSTEDASPAGFARSVEKFGYDVQAAFNLDMSSWLNLGKEFFVFIAVEKSPPHVVGVYELDAESIGVGRSKYRRWLALVDHCERMKEWPGYDPAIVRLSLPMWALRKEENLLLN